MRSLIATGLLAFLLSGCGGGGGSGAGMQEPLTVIVPSLTPQYTVTVQSDIVYAQGEVNGGGTVIDLELDLYIPDEPTVAPRKQFPLMLMMHGGFFQQGYQTGR